MDNLRSELGVVLSKPVLFGGIDYMIEVITLKWVIVLDQHPVCEDVFLEETLEFILLYLIISFSGSVN